MAARRVAILSRRNKMEAARGARARPHLVALVLIVSVAAVVAHGYYERVDKAKLPSRLELHHQIVSGTAPSPYRYRVLVPLVCEGLTRALSHRFSHKYSFLLAYAAYDFLSVAFLLVMLFFWLRTWFTVDQSLIGCLFVAGTMQAALRNHHFQPWSLLEAGLFTAALLAIERKRDGLLPGLVVLASLNRETAVFIPLAYLSAIGFRSLRDPNAPGVRRRMAMAGALFILWALVFVGSRLILGSAPHVVSVKELLADNLSASYLRETLFNGAIFLGGFWVFAFLGWRYAPRLVKRLSAVVPLYLLTVAVWGVWYETRLLMPLYPILVPLGLSFLYLRDEGAGRTDGRDVRQEP